MTRLAEEGQERWEWNLPAGYTPDDSERWVPEIHPFRDRTPLNAIVPVCFILLRCGV